jgi:tetratricopeptide (TPR) repeat protein
VRSFTLSIVLACALAGCAAHRHDALTDRLILRGESSVKIDEHAGVRPPENSLATFIEQVRELSTRARPAPVGTAVTVEASNRELAAALAAEQADPTAESHRRVGEIYAHLAIFDAAFDHFGRAVKADGRDAAAYDQIARIWREWGLPHLGLGDAYRAIYYAPQSPSPYNTLGTLFQAMGRPADALTAYRRALALAPDAAYALNNECSALLALGKADLAIASCRRAVDLDPGLDAARRNLALATGRAAPSGPADPGPTVATNTELRTRWLARDAGQR